MDGTIGEIRMFGGNFAPRTWAFCAGQLLPINQNQALFSILGTTYGGDGRTTFALPDLRGRVAIGDGNGPGLSDYRLGAKGGIETVTLNTTEIPSHNHTAIFDSTGSTIGLKTGAEGKGSGKTTEANGNYLGNAADQMYRTTAGSGSINGLEFSSTGTVSVGFTGGTQAHENRQPFQVVNFIICLTGVFPSRS